MRRTQKVTRSYRDGGRVLSEPPADGAPAAAEETAATPAASPAPAEPSAEEAAEIAAREESDRAVLAALEQQKQAEELSRLSPAERALRSRGMSMQEAAFTLQHPEVLDPANIHFVAEAYNRGQKIGLKRNSPELFNLVLLELQERREAVEGADRLDREA